MKNVHQMRANGEAAVAMLKPAVMTRHTMATLLHDDGRQLEDVRRACHRAHSPTWRNNRVHAPVEAPS